MKWASYISEIYKHKTNEKYALNILLREELRRELIFKKEDLINVEKISHLKKRKSETKREKKKNKNRK